jgi:hypothetical protein
MSDDSPANPPDSDTLRRFVVLHHHQIEHPEFAGPHFDWMWEEDSTGPLTTLRCPNWPPLIGDRLAELDPHRRIYLTYEGPVSNNRGRVDRILAGTFKLTPLTESPATFTLTLIPEPPNHAATLHITLQHLRDPNIESDTLWIVQHVEQVS